MFTLEGVSISFSWDACIPNGTCRGMNTTLYENNRLNHANRVVSVITAVAHFSSTYLASIFASSRQNYKGHVISLGPTVVIIIARSVVTW